MQLLAEYELALGAIDREYPVFWPRSSLLADFTSFCANCYAATRQRVQEAHGDAWNSRQQVRRTGASPSKTPLDFQQELHVVNRWIAIEREGQIDMDHLVGRCAGGRQPQT